MSEVVLCGICGNELYTTYFANEHQSVRCINCEKKREEMYSSNDSKVDK